MYACSSFCVTVTNLFYLFEAKWLTMKEFKSIQDQNYTWKTSKLWSKTQKHVESSQAKSWTCTFLFLWDLNIPLAENTVSSTVAVFYTVCLKSSTSSAFLLESIPLIIVVHKRIGSHHLIMHSKNILNYCPWSYFYHLWETHLRELEIILFGVLSIKFLDIKTPSQQRKTPQTSSVFQKMRILIITQLEYEKPGLYFMLHNWPMNFG